MSLEDENCVLSRRRKSHTQDPSLADDAALESDKRRSLKPLLKLKPYLLRYKQALAFAGLALVMSAVATLAVPIAVRRVIDHGFTGENGALIDQYFMVLIVDRKSVV